MGLVVAGMRNLEKELRRMNCSGSRLSAVRVVTKSLTTTFPLIRASVCEKSISEEVACMFEEVALASRFKLGTSDELAPKRLTMSTESCPLGSA